MIARVLSVVEEGHKVEQRERLPRDLQIVQYFPQRFVDVVFVSFGPRSIRCQAIEPAPTQTRDHGHATKRSINLTGAESREGADANLAQAHAPPMCSTPHIIFCSVEGGMIRWVAALVSTDAVSEQKVLFILSGGDVLR